MTSIKSDICRLCSKSKGMQGSGPKEVHDLCFHTGEISPPAPPPLSPPFLKFQSGVPYLSLEAQISISRPKSQPRGPNPSLKAQISALRPRSQPG